MHHSYGSQHETKCGKLEWQLCMHCKPSNWRFEFEASKIQDQSPKTIFFSKAGSWVYSKCKKNLFGCFHCFSRSWTLQSYLFDWGLLYKSYCLLLLVKVRLAMDHE